MRNQLKVYASCEVKMFDPTQREWFAGLAYVWRMRFADVYIYLLF